LSPARPVSGPTTRLAHPAGPNGQGRSRSNRPSLILGFGAARAYKRGTRGTEASAKLAWAYAYSSPAFGDPGGSGAIVAAVQWLQNTLLGTVATTVAVICVATVGLMMLSGRIDLRRGAAVVVGCFILFGASSIAAGIRSVASGDYAPPEPVYRVEPWTTPTPPPPPPQTYIPTDPYAGAAVPTR
jgi:type IV secretion system protein VirB2